MSPPSALQSNRLRKAVPPRRKQPARVNRWYLTLYLRRHNFWLSAFSVWALLALLVQGGGRVRQALGDVTLPALLLMLTLWVYSVAKHIYKTQEELGRQQKRVQSIDALALERFLRQQMALPPELVASGYEVVEGGYAGDLFNPKLNRFAGFAATSTALNRVLRGLSARGLPPFLPVVPASARQLGFSALGATLVGWLARHVGWHWLLTRCWPLPQRAREVFPSILGALPAYASGKLANERKIRLSEDLLLPLDCMPRPLSVERTDYLSDLATGHITGVAIKDKRGGDLWTGYEAACDWLDGRWQLKPCVRSDCANHIGVSAMALGVSLRKGPDGALERVGHMYVVGQTHANLAGAGLLAPSGSGSLDWSDLTDFGDDVIELGMQREMLEETWFGKWDRVHVRGHMNTRVTGYARTLHRGGKPDFYGLIVMPREAHEYGVDPSEESYAQDCFQQDVYPLTIERFEQVIADFMRREQLRLSHALFMCLTLLREFLREEPAQFQAMLDDAASHWG